MSQNISMPKIRLVFRPTMLIVSAGCFVSTAMIGRIGDALVYTGQISASFAGMVGALFLFASIGFTVESVIEVYHVVK